MCSLTWATPTFWSAKTVAQIQSAFLVADAAAGRDDRSPVAKRVVELAEASMDRAERT